MVALPNGALLLVLLLVLCCVCISRAASHDRMESTEDRSGAWTAPAEGPSHTGMTSRFFHDFFPALWRFLPTNVWHLLQPTHIVHACPEMEVVVPGLGRVRNPTLLPFQVLGVAVGLRGAHRLLAPSARESVFYWGCGFLFFGLMNLTSIACHAFLAHSTRLWAYTAVVDVVMTGCSSLCLLYQQASCWCQLRPGQRDSLPLRLLRPPSDRTAARALCWRTLCATLLVGFGAHLLGIPWVNELLYLGTTAVAAKAVALVSWSARHTASARQHAFYMVGVAGVLLMLAALPADRFLCEAFGTSFGTVHMLFLGCDVGFWGLYGFVTGHALGLPHPLPAKQE